MVSIALRAMLSAVVLFIVLPLASSSGEGNIHLLEDEVATALRACTYNESTLPKRIIRNSRQSLSDDYNSDQNQYGNQIHVIDDGKQDDKMKKEHNYGDQMYVLNDTENDILNYPSGNKNITARIAVKPSYNHGSRSNNWGRHKRNSIINKSHQDQCLSQCVFSNLQVVDGRGIPREAELWNKVQTVVTSQQSRTVLRDQVHACFQELQTESEDNGCSYSNKLERCLMLRFSDRKINEKNS